MLFLGLCPAPMVDLAVQAVQRPRRDDAVSRPRAARYRSLSDFRKSEKSASSPRPSPPEEERGTGGRGLDTMSLKLRSSAPAPGRRIPAPPTERGLQSA
jgi:hypothetical protein